MAWTPEKEAEYQALNEQIATLKAKQAISTHRAGRESGVIPAEYSPTADTADTVSNYTDNLRAGIGSGLVRVGRGVGNIAGLEHLPGVGSQFTDEALSEQDKLDKPVLDTTMGKVGQFIGQTAATAPISPLTSGVIGQVAGKATPMLLKTLLAATADSALSSAATAAPDQQKDAAASGALWGAGLHLGGKALSRTIRGIVGKSEETKALIDDYQRITGRDDLFIPIHAGAEDEGVSKLVKGTYKNVLPYAPFAGETLDRQLNDAKQRMGQAMLQKTTPVPLDDDLIHGVGRTKDYFNEIYDKLSEAGPMRFKADDFASAVKKRLEGDDVGKALLDSKDGKQFLIKLQQLAESKASGTTKDSILPYNLKSVKDELGSLLTENKGRMSTAVEFARDEIDNLMANEYARNWRMSQAGTVNNTFKKSMLALGEVAKAKDPYKSFKAVSAGVENTGNFNPIPVLEESRGFRRDPLMTFQNASDLTRVLKTGGKATPSPMGRLAAGGLGLTSIAFGATPLSILAAVGTGTTASTKLAQKALYGDTALQKKLADLIMKNPNAAKVLSSAVRRGAVLEATNE
jgi:hypothetical protein